MTGKIYKTSQGQTVDMGALMLKNEDVPAVGNMNVTAGGKKIERPVVYKENVHTASARHPQARRVSNVVKQAPDSSTRTAKARLASEAERLKTLVAAQFITTTGAPSDATTETTVTEQIQTAITSGSTKTDAVVDPLTLTLDSDTGTE